jgi:HEAT repeat protein
MWGVIDTSVLRVARLGRGLADELTPAEMREVFSACRSAKEQVRLLSVAALEDVLSAEPENAASSWTLVSALYDPADEVLMRALQIVERGALEANPDASEIAVAAIVSAYRTGGSKVRRFSISAAAALGDHHPELVRLVASATSDASWEVRIAAKSKGG